MDPQIPLPRLIIDLVEKIFVVTIVAYFVMHTRHIPEIWEKRRNWKNTIVPIIIFGVFSIFGTYGGIVLQDGSIVNFQDLGPMIAGLIAGPLIGLGAGIIGGVHRALLGGNAWLPSSLATVLAGLAAGIVFNLKKGRFIGIFWAAVFAALMEEVHIGLFLVFIRPFDRAVEISTRIGPPMIIVNAVGMAIFAFIVSNLIRERRTTEEKELLRIELEREKRDLEIAREIQESFLPQAPPLVEGFEITASSRPAREVGGDFYDFIPLPKGKWGLVMADVSGKGIPGALFMALSRTLVRASVIETTAVADPVRKVNGQIFSYANTGMFVTLFYAVLDPVKKSLHYTNAGHNPPLLIRSETGEEIKLSSLGTVLGIMEALDLDEKEISLQKEDVLILYTDGVTDAMNGKRERFGEERLLSVIRKSKAGSALDIHDRILAEVMNHAGQESPFDDMTIMVLKCKSL